MITGIILGFLYQLKNLKSMKTKLFLPLITALLFSQVLMAQFRIGIKTGANITKVNGRSFKDEFKYGYHLGGFMELGLGG